MKSFIVSLFVSAWVFSGCGSNTLAPQNPQSNSHALLIKPDTLNGLIYTNYEFRARVSDVPLSDVRFAWNFGDGTHQGPSHGNYPLEIVTHRYDSAGTFNLRVNAYDYFTDSLIAKDSIPVTITDPTHIVDLLPNTLDTTLEMNPNGSFKQQLNFQVVTSAPKGVSYFKYHIKGVNLDTIINGYTDAMLTYYFHKAGDYVVSVEIIGPNGVLYGKDSSTVTIRMPEITLATLQSMTKVSVLLYVDSSTKPYNTPGFINPFSIGLPFATIGTNDYTWSGNSFSFRYFYDNQPGAPTRTILDDRIVGEVSGDLKRMPLVTASVDDSIYNGSSISRKRYGFTIKDLELVSITPSSIIYHIKKVLPEQATENIYYSYTEKFYDPCGAAVPFYVQLAVKSTPTTSYAYVVFSR